MANEGKDGLFDTNLGDGLIDIPEQTEETVVVPAVEPEKEAPAAKAEEEKSAFKQHDDGTIEIDESLQATIDAGANSTEEDGTIIEKTESTEKKKTPSGSEKGDSSPSSSQYLAFAKDRANEGVFLDFTDEDW